MAPSNYPGQGIIPHDVDFDGIWLIIETAFREIHTKNASKLSYEELYRHAYRVVLKKKAESLYKNVCQFEHHWLSNDVLAVIKQRFSPQLLANAESLGGTSANERRVAGESFLKGLNEAWGHHQVCMSMIADVLMYLVSGTMSAARSSANALLKHRTAHTASRPETLRYTRPP